MDKKNKINDINTHRFLILFGTDKQQKVYGFQTREERDIVLKEMSNENIDCYTAERSLCKLCKINVEDKQELCNLCGSELFTSTIWNNM